MLTKSSEENMFPISMWQYFVIGDLVIYFYAQSIR